jgi:hypothetical protein
VPWLSLKEHFHGRRIERRCVRLIERRGMDATAPAAISKKLPAMPAISLGCSVFCVSVSERAGAVERTQTPT